MRAQKNPCPECGEIDIFRKTGEICRECKRLINLARMIEDEQKKLEEDSVFVRFSDTYHWNEYIHTKGREYRSEDPRKVLTRLAISVSKLVISPEWRQEALYVLGKRDPSSGSGKVWIMKRETAEAIQDLREMIPELIDSAYAQGKKDGSNLLLRLASGDMAPNEWIEKTKIEEES